MRRRTACIDDAETKRVIWAPAPVTGAPVLEIRTPRELMGGLEDVR